MVKHLTFFLVRKTSENGKVLVLVHIHSVDTFSSAWLSCTLLNYKSNTILEYYFTKIFSLQESENMTSTVSIVKISMFNKLFDQKLYALEKKSKKKGQIGHFTR